MKKAGRHSVVKKIERGKKLSPLRSPIVFYTTIIATILLVFGKCLSFGFSPMDDSWLIVDKMQFLSDLRNLPELFTQSTLNLFYRPVLHSSFMFDALFYETWPSIFHATNIGLHVLCSLALFRFLTLIGAERSLSVLLCFIFALHPINVQAVAWIPGRNDTLLALFTIASCNCFLRYLKSREPAWLLLHAIAFGLALLTKETALVLPVIYVALIFLFGKTERKHFSIAVGSFWITSAVLSWWLHFTIVGPKNAGSNPLGTTALEFINGFVMQTGKMLIPVQQSIFPLSENVSLVPYVLVLLLLVAILWKFGLRDKQLAGLGLFWFMLFIVMPIWYGASSPQSVHYEHRAYLALPGLLLFLSQLNIPLRRSVIRVSVLSVIALFAILSFRRLNVYSGYFNYAKTATEEAPQVPMFHDMLGFALHQNGKFQFAINSFNEAIRLDSTESRFFNHRGNSWLELKQYRNAVNNYDKVLALLPQQGETYFNRSLAWYSLGDYNAALDDLEKADSLGVTILPDYANALNRALRDQAGKNIQAH